MFLKYNIQTVIGVENLARIYPAAYGKNRSMVVYMHDGMHSPIIQGSSAVRLKALATHRMHIR
jgi:hypothetical protein